MVMVLEGTCSEGSGWHYLSVPFAWLGSVQFICPCWEVPAGSKAVAEKSCPHYTN